MRDKKILYGRRKELRKLILDAKRQGTSVLVRKYEQEMQKVEADLRAVDMYGGAVVMMRTPWKRLLGPNRKYFEEL